MYCIYVSQMRNMYFSQEYLLYVLYVYCIIYENTNFGLAYYFHLSVPIYDCICFSQAPICMLVKQLLTYYVCVQVLTIFWHFITCSGAYYFLTYCVCVQVHTIMYVFRCILLCMCSGAYYCECVQVHTIVYVFRCILLCMCSGAYYCVCVQVHTMMSEHEEAVIDLDGRWAE